MALASSLAVAVTPDAVEFAFTLSNAGDDPVELTFPNGMTADVAVFEGGGDAETGEAVWRWSDGRMFTQALRTETLAPGESLGEELTWTDPSPGTYTAEATLAAADVDADERAAFEV